MGWMILDGPPRIILRMGDTFAFSRPCFINMACVSTRSPGIGVQGLVGWDMSWEEKGGSGPLPLAEQQGQVCFAFQTLSYIRRWGVGRPVAGTHTRVSSLPPVTD